MCQSLLEPGVAYSAHCGFDLQNTAPLGINPVASGRKHFELPQVKKVLFFPAGRGRFLLGREDPVAGSFPEIDLEPYGAQEMGVGRSHAQVTILSGQAFLEDLESINGTAVNGILLQPGEPVPLENGDQILLGKLVLVYRPG